MMTVRSIWFLFFTSILAHVYGRDPEQLPPYDVLVEFSLASVDDKVDHPHLRRELQTVICSANSPHTYSGNNCPSSYPCTCIGSTETSCAYCELDSTRGHLCQVTDSTTTFVNRQTGKMQTCSCHYANGQAYQSCIDMEDRSQTGYPEPIPITLPPTTPSPIPPFTLPPTTPTPIPPFTLPPTTPTPIPPYTLPPTTPTPLPPYQPPNQPPYFTCRATVPQNRLSDDCSGTYPCICGSTAMDCPYCAVPTIHGQYCIGTGSTMTFVEPQTSSMTTCSCDVINGVPQEVCHLPSDTRSGSTTLPPYTPPTTNTNKSQKGGTRKTLL